MYKSFAHIYDKLMYDVDYKKWADYIEEIFKRNHIKPELVVDLGCGTGSFSIEMCDRGYDMIGVDISEDMLACAKSKALEQGMDILFLNQDMREFELYGTVDAIVCLMDSVNYITHKSQLKGVFKLANNYLNPGGLFIFDINTCYKLENILGNNTFHDVGDEAAYIWRNTFDKRRGISEFDLTFFVKEGQLYNRYDEIHYERAYGLKEIKSLVKASGFELQKTYEEFSFSPPVSRSERVFFVCRRPR